MARESSSLRTRRRCTALALLAALALSGCGGGGGHGAVSSSTTRSSVTGSRSSTASSSQTRTTPIRLPGADRPGVTIGDKNYTEQFVLGQLYLQALEAQGFHVNITQNIGPPDVVRRALKMGSLAMYPEYLDVFDQTFAGTRRGFRTPRAAYLAAQTWAQRHGLRLLAPTPFSDTNAIAVTDAYAAGHHLRTIGDLRTLDASFVLGGAAQFETTAPGLHTLASVYGVTPRSFRPLAVGGQYGELDTDAVQAAYVNTTDGELATGDYRVLGDNRRIFGFGNVVPVVSAAILAREGPAFAATIERVDRTLTLSAMRALNDAAGGSGTTPGAVAMQYLQTHGLLTPLPASAGG